MWLWIQLSWLAGRWFCLVRQQHRTTLLTTCLQGRWQRCTPWKLLIVLLTPMLITAVILQRPLVDSQFTVVLRASQFPVKLVCIFACSLFVKVIAVCHSSIHNICSYMLWQSWVNCNCSLTQHYHHNNGRSYDAWTNSTFGKWVGDG